MDDPPRVRGLHPVPRRPLGLGPVDRVRPRAGRAAPAHALRHREEGPRGGGRERRRLPLVHEGARLAAHRRQCARGRARDHPGAGARRGAGVRTGPVSPDAAGREGPDHVRPLPRVGQPRLRLRRRRGVADHEQHEEQPHLARLLGRRRPRRGQEHAPPRGAHHGPVRHPPDRAHFVGAHRHAVRHRQHARDGRRLLLRLREATLRGDGHRRELPDQRRPVSAARIRRVRRARREPARRDRPQQPHDVREDRSDAQLRRRPHGAWGVRAHLARAVARHARRGGRAPRAADRDADDAARLEARRRGDVPGRFRADPGPPPRRNVRGPEAPADRRRLARGVGRDLLVLRAARRRAHRFRPAMGLDRHDAHAERRALAAASLYL